MPLECFRPFINKVATDFTVVADVKSMQFVQPVRDRLEHKTNII